MFQSSPVLWDGRYQIPLTHGRRVIVSILARPVGRALRRVRLARCQRLAVSILARPVGRALLALIVASWW